MPTGLKSAAFGLNPTYGVLKSVLPASNVFQGSTEIGQFQSYPAVRRVLIQDIHASRTQCSPQIGLACVAIPGSLIGIGITE